MNRKHLLPFLLLFCLVCSNLLVFVPKTEAQTQNGSGNISFQRDIIDQVQFSYVNHAFVFSYGQYYLVFRPYFQYAGSIYTLQQALNFLQRQYPNAQYRQVLARVARTIHWGFNYTNLPQAIQTNLQAIYLKLEDHNFPLSVIELEEYFNPVDYRNYTRILIPKANLAFDFGDIMSQDFSVKVNKTGIAIYNVSGKANLYLDPISYSAPTVTVVGFTSSVPCTFWKLWNASYVGGWFVVNNKTNISPTTATSYWTQYAIDAKLVVGDGSTSTYFIDSLKDVTWNVYLNYGVSRYFLTIKDKATFTLGIVLSTPQKSSWKGCTLTVLTNSTVWLSSIDCKSGSSVNFYSCTIRTLYYNSASAGAQLWIENYPTRVWNCILANTVFYGVRNCDFWRITTTVQGANNACFSQPLTGNTFSGITAYSCQAIINSDYSSTRILSDLYSRNSTYVFQAGNWGTYHIYLINPDIDSWTFNFGSYATYGNIYRQYSFDLLVSYANGTAFQNANVTLTKDATLLSYLTFANGTIPTQTLTKGYYNQPNGNTIQDAGNWQLNITTTNPNYQNYSSTFFLNEPKNWKIALQPTTIGTGTTGHSISFALGIALLAVVVIVSILVVVWKRRSD